jgi:hypothetical protein
MIAQYTDREFVNFFYGGLRFGSATAPIAQTQQTQPITIDTNSRLDAGYHRQGDEP